MSVTRCVGCNLNILARGRRVHACLHLVHDPLGYQAWPDLHAPCLTWRHRDLASARISLLVWTRSDLQVRALYFRPKNEPHGRRCGSEPSGARMVRMPATASSFCEPVMDRC